MADLYIPFAKPSYTVNSNTYIPNISGVVAVTDANDITALRALGFTDPPPFISGRTAPGKTYSQNLPSVAGLGAPLLTINVNPMRKHVFVENQSANDLTLVGDAGNETEVWHRKLTGVGANQQGAEWSSNVFYGRVRVFGPNGSQVSAAEF